MKIADLDSKSCLRNLAFKHPETGETCYWVSQWNRGDGGAGVWYKKDKESSQIFPLGLKNLLEALDFEVVQE